LRRRDLDRTPHATSLYKGIKAIAIAIKNKKEEREKKLMAESRG